MSPASFKGALSVESSDPDALVAWLQGRSEISLSQPEAAAPARRCQRGRSGLAIEALKAEIDGGAVEGRVSLSNAAAGGGTRLDAELKGERLDLDAATAFARSLAGPQGEWPDEAKLSLDIGRAISAGQELRPFMAKLGYDPKTVSLDQLKIGEAGGRDAGRRRRFRPRQRHRKAGAEFERRVARPDHRADRAARAGACVTARTGRDRRRARAPAS